MGENRHRIEEELGRVLDRLRQVGAAIMVEELPGALGANRPPADLLDRVQVQEQREVSMVSRSLLTERAHRLAEALERLREGTYGICEECGEAVPPARLKAMPEVTTCVTCQDRLERPAKRLPGDQSRAAGGGRRRCFRCGRSRSSELLIISYGSWRRERCGLVSLWRSKAVGR